LLSRHLRARLATGPTRRGSLLPWLAAILAAGAAVPVGLVLADRPVWLSSILPLGVYGIVYLLIGVLGGNPQARTMVNRVLRLLRVRTRT
jgi:hypothetical protein